MTIKRWLDPDFQISVVADHICIVFPHETVDNDNHFGFSDPVKARNFAKKILESADYFEKDLPVKVWGEKQ